MLKDSYWESNGQGGSWQLVTNYGRKHGFAMRVMNLRHLIRRKLIVKDDMAYQVVSIQNFNKTAEAILSMSAPIETATPSHSQSQSQVDSSQASFNPHSDIYKDFDNDGDNEANPDDHTQDDDASPLVPDVSDSYQVTSTAKHPAHVISSPVRDKKFKIMRYYCWIKRLHNLVNDMLSYLEDLLESEDILKPAQLRDVSEANSYISYLRMKGYRCLDVAIPYIHEFGRYNIHELRNTLGQHWRYTMKPRRDIVWVALHKIHGDLGCWVPAFLEAVVSLQTRWFDKPLDVAYIHRFRSVNGTWLRESTTNLVMVEYVDGDAKTFISITEVLGAAHLLYIHRATSETWNSVVERYYVNRRIDVET